MLTMSDALVGEGFGELVQCPRADLIPVVECVAGFDLVLLDADVEGAAALDLVSYLSYRMPATPILFISAPDAALLGAAARERGATGSLIKPLASGTIGTAVRAAMTTSAPRARRVVRDTGELVRAGARRARGVDHLWAVVLAGGEGRRLRPLVRHVHGDVRPKQYARLVGSRSLLGQTLDRVALLVGSQRTVLVSLRRHRRYLAETLSGRAVTMLPQPQDRGTAAGIMLPVHWIAERDPDATVAIFPSDHYVGHERRFMANVADASAFVDERPSRIVLVGVEPTDPEIEYGWIEPGEPLARVGSTTIASVEGFVEKPSAPVARACLEAGALWNTFVVIARASTLVDVERQLLPLVHAEFVAAVPRLGTAGGVAALRRAYANMPTASFSSAVLEHCAPVLAVSRLSGAAWCDWGSPRRVIRTLRQTGQRPHWLETFTAGRLA